MMQLPQMSYQQQAKMMRLSNMVNINSSTFAQIWREYWRRFTVVPDTRGIDYGARASSNITTAFFTEGIYRLQRIFYNIPLLESLLELDRLNEQPYLKNNAFGIRNPVESINILNFPSLRDRLVDNQFGGDFKAVPRNLRMDDHWGTFFDEAANKQVTVLQKISPNHQLLHHLDYWLDFRHTITKIRDGLDPTRKLPYFEEATTEEVKEAVDTVKAALDHLDKTKLSSFVHRGNNLFKDLENGRYGIKGQMYLDSAVFTLEKIIGSQWGGDGNRIHQRFIENFVDHMKPSTKNPTLGPIDEARKGFLKYFGLYKEPHERAKQFIKKKYLSRLGKGTLAPDLFQSLVQDMQAGHVQVGNKTLHFTFDADKLGLRHDTVRDVARVVSERLDKLTTTFSRTIGEIKNVKTEHMLKLRGKRSGEFYHKNLLMLARAFPGDIKKAGEKSAGAEAIDKILKAGDDSAIAKLFKDGLRAEKVIIKTMGNIDKAAFWPQIGFSIAGILFLYGPFRSFADQQIAQPFQKKFVAKKGDTVGTWAPFLAGDIAGVGTFAQVLNSNVLRNQFKNSYLGRFAIAAVAGTAALFGTASLGLLTMMKYKPDKPTGPVDLPTKGPANAVNPAGLPTLENWLPYRTSSTAGGSLSSPAQQPGNISQVKTSIYYPQPVASFATPNAFMSQPGLVNHTQR